ncbi:MAG: hypothetical protein ACK4YP_03795 [Myxococcota bacterium]
MLRAEGRQVVELVRGERPVESLGGVGPVAGGNPLVEAERRLRETLGRGVVVLADDAGRIDRWTRALLERVRHAGCVLRAAPSPDAVRLEGLAEGDLWDLFHGPDVILHLREDGAKAMYVRTGGVPARVAAETRAWGARGEARWDGGKLRVDRAGIEAFAAAPGMAVGARTAEPLEEPLDELLAWVVLAGSAATPELLVAATGLPEWEVEVELEALEEQGAVRRVGAGVQAITSSRALARWSGEERDEAHRRLAEALPEDAPERLGHLVAAGDAVEIRAAAVTLARSVLDTGAAGKALAMLQLAVREGAGGAPDEALSELARAALVDGSGPALGGARVTLERHQSEPLARLLRAWEAAGERRFDEASVEDLAPFLDVELEAWRLALPVRVAVATDLEEAERRIAAIVPEAGSVIERRRREWLGHLRYRQGRYAEAAELHLEAALTETRLARRANALINAGMAWRDGFRLDAALEVFRAAKELAAEARLPVLEAHGALGERTVGYRLGRCAEPDLNLLDALERLDQIDLLGPACITEGVIAWRLGNHALTARLAERAARAWRSASTRSGELVAMALLHANNREPWAAQALVSEALSLRPPSLAVQVCGLLAFAGARVPHATLAGLTANLPPEEIHRRHGLLALDEALAYCRASPER